MAVVLDAVGGGTTRSGSISGATGFSYTGQTVGSGSNRALGVMLLFDAHVTGTSVHWDSAGTNQLLTSLGGVNTTGANGRVEAWAITAPTSGNKTLKVTWTGTAEVYVATAAWTGVDQTGGVTSFPHFNSATGNSTAPTVTITSAIGNAVMGAQCNENILNSESGTAIWAIDNTGPTIAAGAVRFSGAATVVVSGVIGSTTDWAVAGFDILASTGGGNPFYQTDWPNPQPVQWYRTWELGFDKELIGQGKKPFLQSDWPNPYPVQWYRTWEYSNTRYYGKDAVVTGKQHTVRPDPVVWYQDWSQNLVLSHPSGKPPRPLDWPNPPAVQWYRSWEQQGIRGGPLPFNQKDWPNPIPVVWYRDANQNLVLTRPSGKPFNQQDYPNPIPIQWYRTWEQTGFKVVPIPFRQQDWPVPRPIDKEIRSWTVPGYDPPNVILLPSWWDVPPPPYWDLFTGLDLVLTHPSGKPLNQQDWPNYRPTQPYWDNFIGENGVIYLPTPIPPITTDLHFKFWHEAFGRMGNLGGVN